MNRLSQRCAVYAHRRVPCLKKNFSSKWTDNCKATLSSANERLASNLLLKSYDPRVIIVAADASDYIGGAEILHRHSGGAEKAICHASRSLTAAEKKTTVRSRKRDSP